VDQAAFTESVGSFELIAGTVLSCAQTFNRSCVVAVGSYVVALTVDGLQVFNARNPTSVKQEPVTAVVPPGTQYLVRSGQRVYAAASNGALATVSWLDLPLDGTSPLPALQQTNVYLGGALTAAYPSPNDTLFLQTPQNSLPGFARFGPGLPTYLDVFAANGTAELASVASAGSRVVLHSTSAAKPYLHSFSLQSNAASSLSSNTGTVDITSLSSSDSTPGFFASSRKGSVAWLNGSFDGATWSDIRAFWLVEPSTPVVTPVEASVETFTAQQLSSPIGPLAFIDETTIAAVVISAVVQTPALDIVTRSGPKVTKRIPMPTVLLAGTSVAGDNGYAYVVRNSTVQIFAPACGP
jgi:hypothetical protein